jgi:hypothetical protein
VINAIKFSIGEIEASDQYFDHTGVQQLLGAAGVVVVATVGSVSIQSIRGDGYAQSFKR